MDHSVIRSFSNIGLAGGGRIFAGFPSPDAPQTYAVQPRAAQRIEVKSGDLLRVDGTHHDEGQIAILAFAPDGARAEGALGLNDATALDANAFEHAPLVGWVTARGGDRDDALSGAVLPHMDEAAVLSAAQAVTVWIVHLQQAAPLISGGSHGAVPVLHQKAAGASAVPAPQGAVRDEFVVKRGTAVAYELMRGETLQIIDIHGQQCSDFQALRLRGLDAGHEDAIDSTSTRSMVRRAYPGPGLLDKFYDAAMNPLLRVVQDTCGRHDTFGLACTARGYEERGFPGHVNCSDNISAALAPHAVRPRRAWPAINFFWNTWLDDHHHILTEEAFSRPGDYVAMEAMDDLLCVSTACPDDIDPINGWNPTDIHVRIYEPTTKLPRAIAYRAKEDGPMQISRNSAFHARLEPLTNHFAPARDLWAPVSFPSHGTTGEYWACRNAATLQDMSGLRKFDIVGPDAERLLQQAMTRNVAKLAVWRGTYALMCDQSGEVIDDGTLFRMAPHIFRWCCGSEESGRWLTTLADDMGLQVRIHELGGTLPNLALQGPRSRDILREVAFFQPHVPSLDQMKWFGVSVARLGDRDGAPFQVARTGYTGELGYEIFCAESDALEIWDALIAAGTDKGLIPMGSAALDIIRIEAGLAGAQEFAAGSDAYEAGLGFAVDLDKADFIGRTALARNAQAPRKRLRGLMFDCDDVPGHGAPIFADERQVGVVTSATRSPMFECAIAFARLSVEHCETGTMLEVGQLDGRMKRLRAKVTDIPFFDPKRERARA
ncbi:MAG: DUF1989 domain-containing protein [Pseudomonadota bacterium]